MLREEDADEKIHKKTPVRLSGSACNRISNICLGNLTIYKERKGISMTRVKRGLAYVMAAVMMASSMNVTVYATEKSMRRQA